MRVRDRVAGLALVGGIAGTAFGLVAAFTKDPVPPGLAAAGRWMPEPPAPPRADAQGSVLAAAQPDPLPPTFPTALLPVALPKVSSSAVEPPLATWSREIASRETLDAVLAEAGLDAADRTEVALALGAEHDLRRLRSGHAVGVASTPEGRPSRVTLDVDDGVRIEAIFGEYPEVRVTAPDPGIVTLAEEVRIESSLFAALADAGMPARFAVDLARMLSGTVDFRGELGGGETLRLLWREARVGDGLVGQPDLAFAALDLDGALYEVVWPEDGKGRATIHRDGEVLRVFAQPVEGARPSSTFGRRVHPVFGNVRMHTGVDFAAAKGTPVRATAPGRVAFIGRVGATGTATGPNLRYELLVDGRPTDPLTDERLAAAAEDAAQDDAAMARLIEARTRLGDTIDRDVADGTIGRL